MRRNWHAHPVLLASCATCLFALAFHLPALAQGKPAWKQDSPRMTKGSRESVDQIRALLDEYLRLHAAKDMTAWAKMFLPEAAIVRTADDGKVITYKPAELAASIAEEARKLDSQHETFEDITIDVEGDAASYAGTWRLFHNGKEVRQGRAWYTLVRRDGHWLIASLAWYRRAGSGVR
jgi:ketosteroid isomerase-like protein